MPHTWHLGNDIVDLADPRHEGKAQDRRFLDRVCSEEERIDILRSMEPDRALWSRWAGKEAAFKTLSKFLGGPPVFVHSQFQVVLPSGDQDPEESGVSPAPLTRFGEVRYQDFHLPLRVEISGPLLHALTWFPHSEGALPVFSWGSTDLPEEDEGWREELRPRFSRAEWECVSHRSSALARLAARKAMASALEVDEKILEIRCDPGVPGRRIPRVFCQEKAAPVDLTLSHHGRLLAWAFLSNS